MKFSKIFRGVDAMRIFSAETVKIADTRLDLLCNIFTEKLFPIASLNEVGGVQWSYYFFREPQTVTKYTQKKNCST